jgi:hypothetical protein
MRHQVQVNEFKYRNLANLSSKIWLQLLRKHYFQRLKWPLNFKVSFMLKKTRFSSRYDSQSLHFLKKEKEKKSNHSFLLLNKMIRIIFIPYFGILCNSSMIGQNLTSDNMQYSFKSDWILPTLIRIFQDETITNVCTSLIFFYAIIRLFCSHG